MAEQNDNINLTAEEYEQALSEQNRIRREKLKGLQDAGQDPFQITKYEQTHHSLEIKNNYQLAWEITNDYNIVIEKGTGVFNGDCGVIKEINFFTKPPFLAHALCYIQSFVLL